MDSEEVIAMLKEMTERIREKDPLLQQGIEEDWVCIMTPEMYHAIEEHIVPQFIEQYSIKICPPEERVDRLAGRKVYTTKRAIADQIQYMPEVMARVMYPECFSIEMDFDEKVKKMLLDDYMKWYNKWAALYFKEPVLKLF